MRIFEGGDELMYGTGDVFMEGKTRENVVVGENQTVSPCLTRRVSGHQMSKQR